MLNGDPVEPRQDQTVASSRPDGVPVVPEQGTRVKRKPVLAIGRGEAKAGQIDGCRRSGI